MTTGALIIIGTPIGNLDDLSPRGAQALRNADAIACEDTRRTGKLLAHLGITAPKLLVANEHTEATVATEVITRITNGQRVALVTDAGMPAISDPGEILVRATIDADLTIEIVPGPSALDTAIALSGLPSRRFVFEGFLPRKGSARTARLNEIAAERRTVICYEAPHRLVRTMNDLATHLEHDRPIALLRELTKMHEEHWRGSLGEAITHCSDVAPRGEYVIVIGGANDSAPATDAALAAALRVQLDAGMSTRDAVDAVAHAHNVSHRRAYQLAIDCENEA